MYGSFADIHCHLLPGIDDGASDLESSIAMAQMAVADGVHTIVVTPHQLGNFSRNQGDDIRQETILLQRVFAERRIPLEILPGADVRIEDGMIEKLLSGEVLSLGDHRRHVLLELPHELYFPLEKVLQSLEREGMTGILSHPERNQGILRDPSLLEPLVDQGCLMQVTAGSLMGTFGSRSQELAEWMLEHGLVHFVATDAHGVKARRPLMSRAYDRIVELVGEAVAGDLCTINPELVACGKPIEGGVRATPRRGWSGFFSAKKVG
ncbi:tyrosine-protein phosphatase [Bythopirellula goksoeyrii]|uniref:protein-tyrosine-phosphatase n=1 Tax=Bythopirellula goksoeyrii TaxID=1400387 RepID=A0A5B9QC38_9BACT|nr:CpsB/CapC family capsule biosynthesis tyrosine phosphatase [Bythopirellula goksoeyrii]QEG36528.1 Tyrosine-protein phosphatase YwqE [Bythopirellula goksoeyrii]